MAITATLSVNPTTVQMPDADSVTVACVITNTGATTEYVQPPKVTMSGGNGSLGNPSGPWPLAIAAGSSATVTWGAVFFDAGTYSLCAYVQNIGGTSTASPSPATVTVAAQDFPVPGIGPFTGDISAGSAVADGESPPVQRTLGDWFSRLTVEGGTIPVTATGSTTARTLADRAGAEYWIEDFGDAGAGDWTAILNAAIEKLLGASGDGPGGTLKLGAKTYRVDGKVVFPNSGAVLPRQPSLRIVGSAAYATGFNTPYSSPSGTVLDMRYSGDSVARLDTRGWGLLEISGVTFADLQATPSATPIIQTTNTTLKIHHCGFYTNQTGTSCQVDAIVLGGTSGTVDDTDDSPFQGYGTVIEANSCNGIRRLVYGRTWCNGVVVQNNSLMHRCGTNLAGGAAVEFIGAASNASVGNVVTGNLIEMTGYPYAVRLGNGVGGVNNCTVAFNNLFDPGGGVTQAAVYLDSDATYNTVIAGYGGDAFPSGYIAGGGVGYTTLITSMQMVKSAFPQGVAAASLAVSGASTPEFYVRNAGTGRRWDLQVTGSAGQPTLDVNMTPDGGAADPVATIMRDVSGTGYVTILLRGSARNRMLGDGPVEIRSASASALTLGTAASLNILKINDNQIGFFGVGPVARQSATDLAGVIQALKNYGLLA